MFRSIGEEKSQLLLAFHTFAGCDQTLPFAHFDQKTAWEAWGAMGDVMAAFQALSKAPVERISQHASCMIVPAPLGK